MSFARIIRLRSFGVISAVLLITSTSVLIAQTGVSSVPSDPLELATGPTKVLGDPQDRVPIMELIERARQNFDLQAAGSAPYRLKISWTSSGNVAFTGAGEMEQDWLSAQRWRWNARLGGYSQLRIFYGGRAYDEKSPGPMPLRLQMIRSALLWPVAGAHEPHALIRATPAKWHGTDAMCALFSSSWNPAVETTGRQWEEREYCFDPKSGLMLTYSEAPGIYTVYDYSSALQFHGRVLPSQISIVEGGVTVLHAYVDAIEDLTNSDAKTFTPTADMISRGPGAVMTAAYRFRQFAAAPNDHGGTVQPVIVHASIGPDGRVLDAEALQNPDSALAESALQLVKRTTYRPQTEGIVPRQREAFINVQFRPAS